MSGNDFSDFLPLESQSNPDIFSFDVAAVQGVTSNAIVEEINSFSVDGKIRSFPLLETVTVTTTTKLYRMRGYYSVTSAYEYWISSNPYSETPPSGHTLSNVVVETVLE